MSSLPTSPFAAAAAQPDPENTQYTFTVPEDDTQRMLREKDEEIASLKQAILYQHKVFWRNNDLLKSKIMYSHNHYFSIYRKLNHSKLKSRLPKQLPKTSRQPRLKALPMIRCNFLRQA